jgi:hypothetical protein
LRAFIQIVIIASYTHHQKLAGVELAKKKEPLHSKSSLMYMGTPVLNDGTPQSAGNHKVQETAPTFHAIPLTKA